LSNNSSNSDEPWADLFTAPVLAPNDVDLLNFELDELLTMHRVLYLAKKKFIGRLGQELIAVNNAAKEQQQTPQSGSPQYSSNPLPGQRPTLGVNPTLRASAQSGQDLEGYDQQQQGYMNQQQPQAGRGTWSLLLTVTVSIIHRCSCRNPPAASCIPAKITHSECAGRRSFVAWSRASSPSTNPATGCPRGTSFCQLLVAACGVLSLL